MSKIKVFVIDDSAVVRQVIGETLGKAPDIEVIGTASDPLFALDKMARAWPDVIVLDVEMPRMDGISFLKRIMKERPTPTIICSSLTEEGAQTTLDALSAGAVEIITKPKSGVGDFLRDASGDLVHAVRAAARANLGRLTRACAEPLRPSPKLSADAVLAARQAVTSALPKTTDRVVAIGTSTGGTQALQAILTTLPAVSPGMVVVQHMPEKFTEQFARRLNQICAVEVREAKAGDRVLPGLVLIAPGGRHMTLKRNGAQYVVDVIDGPLVNRHRPSVDVLFRSVAQVAGPNALGIIMTGMGDDGARGLKEMRDAGAPTVAEDESTCVVFGMPMEAIRLGAAQKILPLGAIAGEIEHFL